LNDIWTNIFRCEGEKEVGFALFIHNFSTFLGRAAITWRICLSSRNTVEKDMGKHC
jgi:hypothetical protein